MKESPLSERDKICKEFGYDPISTLSLDDWTDVPQRHSVLRDAIIAVSRLGADVLRPLLRSSQPTESSRALHVFSELGRKGGQLIEDALIGVEHPWSAARWDTLEGVLYHLDQLSAIQVSKILPLASDPESLVRKKAIEVISFLPIDKLSAGIRLLQSGSDAHTRGLDILRDPLRREDALSAINSSDMVEAGYGYAAFLRAAHAGVFWELPDEIGTDESSYVAAKIAHRKRFFRRR